MKPDLIVMAKQLSGAYFPISAVGIADHIHDTVAERAHELGTFGHGFTYGGHPVGAAIALEAIQIYEDMDLVDVVGRRSERLREQLQRVGDLVEVAEIRLVGLMAGVEIGNGVDEPSTRARQIVEEAEGRGVLFRLIGSTIAISPPLIVSDHEIDHLVDVLGASILATRGSTS